MEKLRPELENIMQLNGIHVDDLITKKGKEDKKDVIMRRRLLILLVTAAVCITTGCSMFVSGPEEIGSSTASSCG